MIFCKLIKKLCIQWLHKSYIYKCWIFTFVLQFFADLFTDLRHASNRQKCCFLSTVKNFTFSKTYRAVKFL